MDITANHIINKFNQAEELRQGWNGLWQNLSEYLLPTENNFYDVGNKAPNKSNVKVFDSTAQIALTRFCSVMESILTPRSQTWHSLETGIEELDNDNEIKRYLEEITKILFNYRQKSEANFYNEMAKAYNSLGVFGTAIIFIDYKPGFDIYYQNIPLSQIYILESAVGRIDTVFRKYKLTARQALQEFKEEKISEEIKRAALDNKKCEIEYEFIHAVYPRTDRDVKAKNALNKEFASFHLEEKNKNIVRESGYDSLPYAVSRYEVASGEIYGRSPALQVLPDIKQLNIIEQTTLRAARKAVDPPILLKNAELHHGFNLNPGALNYGLMTEQGQPLAIPFNNGANISVGFTAKEQKQKIINDGFLVNLFQILIEAPQMTATEVLERSSEKASLMGPIMGRQQSELLASIITREIDILREYNLLPSPPEKLVAYFIENNKGGNANHINVRYESPLSKAQRSTEALAVSNGLSRVLPLIEYNPQILEILNLEEAARILLLSSGAPAKILKSPEEVKAIRQQKEQEINKDEGNEQLKTIAEIAPKVTGAVGDINQMLENSNVAPEMVEEMMEGLE